MVCALALRLSTCGGVGGGRQIPAEYWGLASGSFWSVVGFLWVQVHGHLDPLPYSYFDQGSSNGHFDEISVAVPRTI